MPKTSGVKKRHRQHFIDGIGDGNLLRDFDLPDARVELIRKIDSELMDTIRMNNEAKNKHGHRVHDHEVVSPDGTQSHHSQIPTESSHSQHHELQSTLEVPVLALVVIVGALMVFTFSNDYTRRIARRRSDRKLPRNNSLVRVGQKKKTDEWCEDEDYGDCRLSRRSSNASGIPVKELPYRIGGSETARLRKTGATSEAQLPRRRNAFNNGLDGFDVTEPMKEIHNNPQMGEDEEMVRRRNAFNNGFDGFDVPEPIKEIRNTPLNDDEEMVPCPRIESRVRADTDEETPISLSKTDSDVETPVASTKPTIYVDSFAELTMPDICNDYSSRSPSISDGNAKYEDEDLEGSVVKEFDPADSSGETEGANGVLHKRKDLTACSDAASSLHSPIAFSDLKMNTLIGGGGFGSVWSASWRGTPVAVKILSASSQAHSVQKAILQEFAAEINMLSGMRHPNICLYIGACLNPPNRAIVTELAANGSLWDALRLPLKAPFALPEGQPSHWPFQLYESINNDTGLRGFVCPPLESWPWALVRKVAEGAARGMNYLHCGKPAVLHRDLKSANILLDDSYNPKVCDFGLSRIKAHENSMTANCGTVQWMAPEILANQKYAEPADVYSFGIILWELLTSQCPYEGMTSIQCAMAVLNKDIRPEIPNWCPKAFARLIQSCVDKEPSNRPTFTTILSIIDALPK